MDDTADYEADTDLLRLTTDLARSLRDLQQELEPRRGRRPPSPRDLLRFTDEVAIPATILILETNVRALKLLQRAIRLSDRRGPDGTATDTAVRDRAAALSRSTLHRLDDALADVQDAIEGRPPDDDARALLDEARELRAEIDARLEPAAAGETASSEHTETDESTAVPVDVDAELRSIKDEIDDDER